jgi:enamine deaminase RidA (YjgF/YER057c/UK114 family)
MSDTISSRLAAMGVNLPEPAKPVAAYVGFVRHGDLVFVSGQLPFVDGKLRRTGHLGRDVSIEEGAEEARQCAINLLAQMNVACEGDLERIARCIKLTGFVAGLPTFADHPKVINGASEFIGQVLGERGQHARAAVGVSALPLNACVEVEAIFAIS